LTDYKIAIIGSGPAGLSAAAHAAELGISYVLLEGSGSYSKTLHQFQKGKHVMAEPSILPLRSPMKFEAGTRENILQEWQDGIARLSINIRYNTFATGIAGSKGSFDISLSDGSAVSAEHIVLAIGVQGNPRKVGVTNDDHPAVLYTLADPAAYANSTIMVIGAGDAAIENALALSEKRLNNRIIIVNRRDEFARAKEGNLNAISAAIDNKQIECMYSSSVAEIVTHEPEPEAGQKPLDVLLNTAEGQTQFECDALIARLGAIPPRKFLDDCGIQFPNDAPTALPVLSSLYESSVDGLYVVGALAGYPLIKQAMNQGYEVVETIEGRDVEPADTPLLEEKLTAFRSHGDVNGILAYIQEALPIFAGVNPLMFREVMLDSKVHALGTGDNVFLKNDYSNTFYTVVEGSVDVWLDGAGRKTFNIKPGNFFGEMGLLTGRRRSATVVAAEDCLLIETPRRTMIKLLASEEAVQKVLDQTFILRTIQSRFAPSLPMEELRPIADSAQINRFSPGAVLFAEGDEADELHLIRKGSVQVSQQVAGKDVVLSYVPAGHYVGEMGLLGGSTRMASVTANVATETISLDSTSFEALLEKSSSLRSEVRQLMQSRFKANTKMGTQTETGNVLSFLLQQGLGEATDVLLIDETLCVGCDNCEKACAETHDGTSRLNRQAGPSFANIHVPTSCRHCENPHCMKDCPPDAISRTPSGEVFVSDACIGCGNCEQNCPYDVIQMAAKPPPKPGLFQWLLLGSGPGPGQDKSWKAPEGAVKKAVKCDMCKDLKGGAACVRACPTGAALRIGPEKLIDLIENRDRRRN
jgi:CRP-like cAMP-binding protein/thioredoxin reductase/ferredoxin-like protein FixX